MISPVHLAYALLTLFPGRVGGSESNVRGLLSQYAGGNGPDRVTVLANRHVAAAYGDFERGPVEIEEIHSYRPGDSPATRLLAMITAAAAPGRVARGVPSGADVLHHPVTVPIPALPGVPTVTTVYDVQHHELPQMFSRAERQFRRWAYDGAARRADAVVTTSEYSRARLVDLLGLEPERVTAIAMGLDHDRFHPGPVPGDEALLEPLGLPGEFVVYPANLWPHKNHDRLVDALARAQSSELALLLTGQDYGRATALIERARRAGLGDRVRHLGYLEARALPALLRRAKAMVFPSLYEGFGSPPLEAMACACPVACSDRGSLAETAGDAAVPLDPESVESIAAAIDTVTSDDALRERLREAGLRRAAGFRWERTAADHLALYARVAG